MDDDRHTRATATIEEVAATFGIARSTAYHLAKLDRLPVPVIRLGRRMVVSRAALSHVLEAKGMTSEGVGHGRF